jgi:co-chaperonin GroES (HSP10)
MSLKGKTNIYDSPSQLIEIDPATIRLISDRCLIRDLGDPERVGSIIIPEVARDKIRDEGGTLRIGLVIATGPGDRFIEVGLEKSPTEAPRVLRRLITIPCGCEPMSAERSEMFGRKRGARYWFDIVNYQMVEFPAGETCPVCHDTGRIPITIPPQCHRGQKVLYSRRREAEVTINGERYSLVNAEQSILAVLED